MLYALHEAAYYASSPWRMLAKGVRDFWGSPINPAHDSPLARNLTAGAELFSGMTRRYGKPDWHIDQIEVNGMPVRVRPTTVCRASGGKAATALAPQIGSGFMRQGFRRRAVCVNQSPW